MRLICLFLVASLCVVAPEALSKDKTYGHLRAQVRRVVDGDTIVVNIPDYPAIVGQDIPVRLAGCDTPELRDKRPAIRRLARLAKEHVCRTLASGATVELRNIRRGKYFRLVAEVYVNGQSLAGMLIQNGLGKTYQGGTRRW